MTNLSRRNDRLIAVHNKCSKFPLSTSVHFVTHVWRSHIIWVDLVSFCGQQHLKCEQSISCIPPFFCILCSSSIPSNKNLMELGLDIQTTISQYYSKLDTCSYEHFPHNDWSYYFQIWLFLLNNCVHPCPQCTLYNYPDIFHLRHGRRKEEWAAMDVRN